MLLFHTATVLSVSWFFVAPYVVRLPTAVAKSTNNVNLKNSRWEESRIWPAPSVELYDTVYHTVLLRTFVCSHWALELIGNHSDSVHDILHAAEARFGQFLEIGTPSLASNDSYYPVNPDGAELAALDGIRIEIFNNKTASSDFRLHHDVDESYQIHIAYPINTTAITSGNWIEIQSETVVGALRALETVKQLLQFAWMENDNAVAVYVIRDTPLYIQDSPEYPYRGLMIDTARHYLSVDLIVSNLYVMAANKLNALHWHMTDSQSWPYDSAAFPELAASGAYCVECHYTKDQIQSVIDEASLLGIRVIVEVDLPGHSQAIGRSHPEWLSSCQGEEPMEPLDVTEPAVTEFVHRLYSELTDLFTDEWIHIGGDEVSLACWKNSTKIQNWMKLHNITDEVKLLENFELDLVSLVHDTFIKRPVAWQDLFDSGVELPPTTVLGVWKSWTMTDSVMDTTAAGYDIVFSACWYLDHLNDDWWSFYKCNPRGFSNLTVAQQSHILGGHSSMWGERVDSTDFFERVWPRTSAVAEVLWSGGPRNYSDLSYSLLQERLSKFRCWMVQQFDIPVSPIEPGFCAGVPLQKGPLSQSD